MICILTIEQIENDLINDKITITINETREDWLDLPSPPPEDLESAMQICDHFKFPDPVVPDYKGNESDSWD